MTGYITNPYNLTFCIYLFICQIVLWRAMKNRQCGFAVPIAIVTDSVVASLLFLEIVLYTGIFDDDYRWTPLRFHEQDQRINDSQQRNAERNPFGFNDEVFPLNKPAGTHRIAVIGDSFIFGDGVPYDQIWGVKFRKLVITRYPNLEVLLWGKNGWSTRAEFKFLKTSGLLFKPDLLIVGFVTNDPSPCDFDCIYRLTWQNSPALDPVRGIFPESVNFISALVNRFIESHSNLIGYENYENALYSEKNLALYSSTLTELSQFCAANHLPVLIVLTPNNYSEHFHARYLKIKPLMLKAGLPVLDLLPAVTSNLGHIPAHQLWASRANGHPGSLLTTLYAEQVSNYLQKENLIRPK